MGKRFGNLKGTGNVNEKLSAEHYGVLIETEKKIDQDRKNTRVA